MAVQDHMEMALPAYDRPTAFNGDRVLTHFPTLGGGSLADYDFNSRRVMRVRFLPDRRHFLLWMIKLYSPGLTICLFHVTRQSPLAEVLLDFQFAIDNEAYVEDYIIKDK